jgi:hypothetical protein
MKEKNKLIILAILVNKTTPLKKSRLILDLAICKQGFINHKTYTLLLPFFSVMDYNGIDLLNIHYKVDQECLRNG